jgi:hypothetical protein
MAGAEDQGTSRLLVPATGARGGEGGGQAAHWQGSSDVRIRRPHLFTETECGLMAHCQGQLMHTAPQLHESTYAQGTYGRGAGQFRARGRGGRDCAEPWKEFRCIHMRTWSKSILTDSALLAPVLQLQPGVRSTTGILTQLLCMLLGCHQGAMSRCS